MPEYMYCLKCRAKVSVHRSNQCRSCRAKPCAFHGCKTIVDKADYCTKHTAKKREVLFRNREVNIYG